MATAVGRLIWGILTVYATVFTFGFIQSYRKGEVIAWASVNQMVLLWLICVWTLIKPSLPRLHLLWLAPVAFLLPMFMTPWLQIWRYRIGWLRPGSDILPPGLILFVIGFGAILFALTR